MGDDEPGDNESVDDEPGDNESVDDEPGDNEPVDDEPCDNGQRATGAYCVRRFAMPTMGRFIL